MCVVFRFRLCSAKLLTPFFSFFLLPPSLLQITNLRIIKKNNKETDESGNIPKTCYHTSNFSADHGSFTSSLGIVNSHYFPVLSAGGQYFNLCFPESNPLFNAVGKVEMKYRSQGTFPV